MLKSCYRSLLEAGTDEAGRGCLAGPVTAAAIILPEKFNNITLNDSKQLSETKRDLLKPILEENVFQVGLRKSRLKRVVTWWS